MKQLKKHLRQKQWESKDSIKNQHNEIKQENNKKKETNGQERVVKTPSKSFIPGVIVKVEVVEPLVDLKQFKVSTLSSG